VRKEVNAGGQFSAERSRGTLEDVMELDLPVRGRGTEGGSVVQRRAAKYKHKAGPVIIKSPSALARRSTSTSFSSLACVKDDLR